MIGAIDAFIKHGFGLRATQAAMQAEHKMHELCKDIRDQIPQEALRSLLELDEILGDQAYCAAMDAWCKGYDGVSIGTVKDIEVPSAIMVQVTAVLDDQGYKMLRAYCDAAREYAGLLAVSASQEGHACLSMEAQAAGA